MLRWVMTQGADPTHEDQTYNDAPLVWARYSQADSVYSIMEEFASWREAHTD